MPRLQVMGGNQPPIPDGQLDFGGGQNSFLPAHRLAPNECQRMVNCDILRLGDVVTRRGSQLLGWPTGGWRIKGLGYFDVAGIERLVRVHAGGVEMHGGSPSQVWLPCTGWTTASWTPAPDSGHCSIVQGNNTLFISNGEGIRTWDGVNWSTMQSDYTDALACPLLLHATNRLIAAGSAEFPDTVWFSNFLEEDKWSGVNSIRVGAGDGDPITGMTLWTNTLLVVFKRSSVYLVDINPAAGSPSAFQIDTASKSIGCVGPRAFAKVGKDLWFYSDHGLRSLARVLEGQDTEVSPAISYPLSDVISQVDESRLAEVSCTFYNDVFFMSLPLGSAGAVVLPVRLVAGAPRWLGTWTGAWSGGVSHWCRSYVGGVQRLNLAIGDRCYQWLDHVREVDESIATYMDSPSGEYETEIVTRSFSFGDESLWKQGFTIEAEFNRSRGRVELHAIRDGETDEQPVLTADSGLAEGLQFPFTFPIQFPPTWERIKVNGTLMHMGRFRELAVRCRAKAGKLSLRKIQATAFAGSMHAEST